jgi:hypothetical protein
VRILFQNSNYTDPKVSVVLVDWSCRESFHILRYLSDQTVPRDQYELIWIEYFQRKAPSIQKWLEESIASGKPPILDKWIVMEMPTQVYYHKHLMYNVGIVASRGNLLTICDSDAVAGQTFVESIINAFEKDKNIVLHMDQLRNMDKRFYPFNYPSIQEIRRTKCLNSCDGKPIGLVDRSAPLHLPNYGACFSAIRKDLIAIGGADEHIDYLGHICGPYEMTFRLVNAGRTEIWHQDEWLYHLWHPGQSGDNNFAGPHDGRHMSQTALTARKTGRILPLVENNAIKKLRLGQSRTMPDSALLDLALSGVQMKEWRIDNEHYSKIGYRLGRTNISMRERESADQRSMKNLRKEPLIFYELTKIFIKIYLDQFRRAIRRVSLSFSYGRPPVKNPYRHNSFDHVPGTRGFLQVPGLALRFFKRQAVNVSYMIQRCQRCLYDLNSIGVKDIVLFGSGPVAEALRLFSQKYSINIRAVYDTKPGHLKGYPVPSLETLRSYEGKIIVSSFDDVERKTEILKAIGISPHKIVDLW